MSLTKLSLAGNNLIIYYIIPAQGEFGKFRLGAGKSITFFYSVRAGTYEYLLRMARVEQLTDDPPEAPSQRKIFLNFNTIPITSLMTSNTFLKAHL
jgi:hypothetical protein